MQDTEELKARIEEARERLNASIQSRESLPDVLDQSKEVDELIAQYLKRLETKTNNSEPMKP